MAGDDNGRGDVFLRDRRSGTTSLLSRSRDGGGADGQSFRPVMSGDATVMAYLSEARNLVAGDTSPGYQVYAVGTGVVAPPQPQPDTKAPWVRIRAPKQGSTVRRTMVAVRGVARDDRAVSKVQVKVRNRGTKKWLRANGRWGRRPQLLRASLTQPDTRSTAFKRRARLPRGRYVVIAIARDAAGHRSKQDRRRFVVKPRRR